MRPSRTIALPIAWALCCAALAGEPPPPSIGVSPTRIELDASSGGTTGSATVLNLSDRPVHIAASVVDFDLDEQSNFRELPPRDGSLPLALMVNPVDFTIAPRSSQTVRFAISPERLAGDGEHRAMLFFSELVETTEPTIKLNYRLGVPIYVLRGKPVEGAEIHELRVNDDGTALELDLTATGNIQVRPDGRYAWWRADAFPGEQQAFRQLGAAARDPERKPPASSASGRVVTKPVFPGTRRALTSRIEFPVEPGSHVLAVQVDAGGSSITRTFRIDTRVDTRVGG